MERLVIEIDGNASGLTKELGRAQRGLTGFNDYVKRGNASLGGFQKRLTSTATSLGSLSNGARSARTSLATLTRTSNSLSSSFSKLSAESRSASSGIKSFGTALSGVISKLNGVSTASRGATTSINSLNRRAMALGTTVTSVNAALRGFLRGLGSIQAGTGGLTVINNYTGGLNRVGGAAGRTGGLFGQLRKQTIGMAEGFRRTVAQITALRTLTYQALFWFAPLVYSIIKVNAAYERQMQLLKNLSGEASNAARLQWAEQTRQKLIELANTNPFSLEQITGTFVRMKVSGLDPLNGSLQTLMDSIAAFGGGNEELDRAGVALQQMVGKSAVSMEELRQQLGEHIPDAMSAMAKGMGLSMADFYDAVKKGTVESTSAIAKMLAVLNAEHRGAAAQMMNTWNGLMARLGTTWQNFVAKITTSQGNNSFISRLKEQVIELMTFMNTPAGVNFAISVQNALASVVDGFAALLKWMYRNRDTLIELAKIFAYYLGGKLVIGTLARVIGVFFSFGKAIQAVVVIIRVFTGANTAASAAAMLFGRNTLAAATATRVLSAGASASAGSLGLLAIRFGIVAAAAVAAAAAIWLIVRAIQAQTAALNNKALAEKAASGGTFDENDPKSRQQNEATRRRLLQEEQWRKKGGHYVTDTVPSNIPGQFENQARWVPWTAQNERQHVQDVRNYNVIASNTRNARQNADDFRFEATQPDPYAKTRATFNAKQKDITDGAALNKIEIEKNKALAEDATRDIERLTNMKKTASASTQGSIDKLIEKRIADRTSYLAGAVTEGLDNKFIAGKDDGKKKKGDKDKVDPLEKYRDRYAQSFVRSEEMQLEYKNLRDGTGYELDMDAAEATARATASKIKDKDALDKLIISEKERQSYLKDMIEIEKRAIDLENDNAKSYNASYDALEEIKLGYSSITLSVDHYREELLRNNKTQLDWLQTQLATEPVTENQIALHKEWEHQYKRLTGAIDDAVRAKQAELLVDEAKNAQSANEDYYASFRTPRQQANFEDTRSIASVQSAIATAKSILEGTTLTQKALDLRKQLADTQVAMRAAEARGDEATRKSLEQDIVVTGQRLHDEESRANQIARDTLPILEERLRILQQEMEIRNRLGGFGGAMYDWAKEAAKGLDSIGESLGQLVTSGLDDLVNGLIEGKMAFGDFVKSILKGLLAIIIRALLAKAILMALGIGGAMPASAGNYGDPTGFQPTSFDIGHTGMIIGGTPGGRTAVSPAAFAFAQRYHTGGIVGLRPNEVPIVAEKGEGVFTKEQMKAMGQSNKGSNVTVNVINQTGTQADVVREQPKFDGEKWVETIILKKMAQPGPVRDIMTAGMKR